MGHYDADRPEGKDWQAVRDELRNFLRSEECLEVSQLLAALP
jgi:hypothetical protein